MVTDFVEQQCHVALQKMEVVALVCFSGTEGPFGAGNPSAVGRRGSERDGAVISFLQRHLAAVGKAMWHEEKYFDSTRPLNISC